MCVWCVQCTSRKCRVLMAWWCHLLYSCATQPLENIPTLLLSAAFWGSYFSHWKTLLIFQAPDISLRIVLSQKTAVVQDDISVLQVLPRRWVCSLKRERERSTNFKWMWEAQAETNHNQSLLGHSEEYFTYSAIGHNHLQYCQPLRQRKKLAKQHH